MEREGGTGDTVTMKTSPTPAAPHARVLRFFFSHRERNGRKRDGELENSLGRDREKEKEAEGGEGGESEKERTCCVYFQSC